MAAAEPGSGETLHASSVLIGEAGILILGASGAGKSTLAHELVVAAALGWRFARLVSDDRTRVAAHEGRLVARPAAAIAGRIELRGLGLLDLPHEAAAVVRLCLHLSSGEPPRFPESETATVSICGVVVPRLFLKFGACSAAMVLTWLDRERPRS